MIFSQDVIKLAKENTNIRHVLFTTDRTQLVLMSIAPSDDIGEEIHKADQILLFVAGEGVAILDGITSPVLPHYVVVVPAGTKHNFKNNKENWISFCQQLQTGLKQKIEIDYYRSNVCKMTIKSPPSKI